MKEQTGHIGCIHGSFRMEVPSPEADRYDTTSQLLRHMQVGRGAVVRCAGRQDLLSGTNLPFALCLPKSASILGIRLTSFTFVGIV